MTDSNLRKLNQLLKQRGYKRLSTINKDDYSRFSGIIVDREEKKYFIKAVTDKNSYAYRSLCLEAKVTKYLSEKTRKLQLVYKGYRLYVPTVEEVIDQDEVFCLITSYIEGKRLVDENSKTQANALLITLELVAKLSEKTQMSIMRPYLKNYTRKALLFFLPIRYIKATVLSPFALAGLTRAFWRAMSLLSPDIYEYGLVHPDINVSNIVLNKNVIYLTDWEEAGWGMSAYNTTTPLCFHWLDKKLRDKLFRTLQDIGQKRVTIPLLAYRVLMLFNQNIESKSKKRKRDIMVLKFLEKM